MASKIKINTNSLKADASSIGSSIQKINKSLTNLQSDMAKLDAMWDGPASESFKIAYKSDISALNTVISNLKKLNNFENTARTKYDSCEQKVGSIVSSIKV